MDGLPDLAALSVVSRCVTLLVSQHDGTFAGRVQRHLPGDLLAISSADLDGDGDKDLAVSENTTDSVKILLNSCS
jgi:VCBS repeat protein